MNYRQKPYNLQFAIKVGLDELERGEGIELQDDTALAAFFDDIEAEVEDEKLRDFPFAQ